MESFIPINPPYAFFSASATFPWRSVFSQSLLAPAYVHLYNAAMSRISSLYHLQTIDTRLDQIQQRLEEIEAIFADDKALRRCQKAATAAEEYLKKARSTSKKAEHNVDMQLEKIERTDKTLYGGKVQNPKELQDLQTEAESLRRFLTTLEDRLLEAMIAQEDAEAAFEVAQANLKKMEAERAELHASLEDETNRLMAETQRLKDEREVAVTNVPAEDLALYQKLRKSLGVAVVLVHDGTCTACGMTLPQSVRQTVRSGNTLARCSGCKRILYAG